jgi:multidrug/hemolysin transport system permease protein
MKYLVKRNLLLFFRDKSSVFFSLLGVMVIIGLYVLFLGDLLIESMEGTKGARFLMDSWIMAGLLAVTPITTVLGAMGTMIVDKKYKIYKDFSASPIKRSSLAGGYIISGFIISLILTLVTFVLAEGYIIMNGGELLTIQALIKVLGLIILTVLSSSFMMFFMVSCFKSVNEFSTASTVIGTLIGFLTGVYIPIGNLPESVQVVVKIFPPSHAGVLFRKVMMEQAEKVVFAGAPASVVKEFQLTLGETFTVGGKELGSITSILYILAVIALFFVLTMRQITRKVK